MAILSAICDEHRHARRRLYGVHVDRKTVRPRSIPLSVSDRSEASDQVPDGAPVDAGPSVTDLLGVLCYGALVAFDNLGADARLAPDLRRRAALSEMAAAELVHYRRLADRLA